MLITKNKIFLKQLFDLRPVTIRKLTQKYDNLNTQKDAKAPKHIFKFYNENSPNYSDKYRPLDDKDYQRFISSRSSKREPAFTRMITNLAYKVGKKMLSLAEGMPNEDVFPFTRLRLETRAGEMITLEGKELATALQYLPSQGLPALLQSLQLYQDRLHRPPPHQREIIITNGAQHAIYQCFELLLNPGDPIITSEYAYTGAQVAMKPYSPEILGIPEDADGIDVDILTNVLSTRLSQGKKMPKVMYIIPIGNNPSGTILSEDRKQRIYELASQYDFLILEDDPYMFLNYTEKIVPSFFSLDACGRVIRVDSLSKVVSAGMRTGWVTGPAPLIRQLELHMQAELLHSCAISQTILHKLISNEQSLATHLSLARLYYQKRRDALQRSLTRANVGELADWGLPDAGLFFWLRVRGVEDVYDMVLHRAFDRGLMLIPGQAFLYDTSATSPYLRLTFSKVPIEHMDAAAQLLADLVRDEQRACRLENVPRRLRNYSVNEGL